MASFKKFVKRAVRQMVSPLKRARRQSYCEPMPTPTPTPPPTPTLTEAFSEPLHIEGIGSTSGEWTLMQEWEYGLFNKGILRFDQLSTVPGSYRKTSASSINLDGIQAIDDGAPALLCEPRRACEENRDAFLPYFRNVGY